MFQGKKKALTFSYDDGFEQDIRFIQLLNKYGMKGTFNLNNGRQGKSFPYESVAGLVKRDCMYLKDSMPIYEGHEVAVHTVNHPNLITLSDEDIIKEVEDNRVLLSELCGYEVVGMAYPCSQYDERVIRLIHEHTGVKYSRTCWDSYGFEMPDKLLEWRPTVQHSVGDMEPLFELGKQFLELETDKPQIFCVWGHSYELDAHIGHWKKFEEFLEMMSGRKDICYCTNKECLL